MEKTVIRGVNDLPSMPFDVGRHRLSHFILRDAELLRQLKKPTSVGPFETALSAVQSSGSPQ